MKICIIDSKKGEIEHIIDYFKKKKHSVSWINKDDNGVEKINNFLQNIHRHDLVILGWLFDTEDSIFILQQIRKNSDIPVLILSQHRGKGYIIDALDYGADDYLVKPASLSELDVRVNKLNKKSKILNFKNYKICRKNFCLNLRDLNIEVKGKTKPLTKTEFQILSYLMTQDRVVSKMELAQHTSCNSTSKHLLNMHITNLRRKLGKRSIIKNIPHKGFIIK